MATTKKKEKAVKANTSAKKNKSDGGNKKSPSPKSKKAITVGPPVEPSTVSVGSAEMAASGGMIFAWEDDPMSIPYRQPIQVPTPTLPTGTLGITIVDPAPPAQTYPIGSSRFRYWTAAEALTRGMKFWQALLPASTKWATPDKKLRVHLDMGVDLNAYYRRSTSTLEFFHSTVSGKTVFSGESPGVVCHELGHAVLDAIRPELFHVANIESAAFHESFGDISAILCGLQIKSVVQAIIDETGGRLYHSTFLSRVAEELGWAIRQIRPQNVEPDCLRNAVNSFFYRDPMTLPTTAPASSLSSAPHSFSRVFTAAFFDAVAGMVLIDNPQPTITSIQKVSRNAGQLLIDAVGKAPITPNYFSQIAAQIITSDETRYSRKYRDVLKGAFVRHGILSLEAAAAISGKSAPVTAVAGILGEAVTVNNADSANLITVPIPVTALGFSSATILCASPGETGGYQAAAAAALDTGSLSPPAYTDAIKSFVEDLLRLGRIDVGNYGDSEMQISQPIVRKTHALTETGAGPMLTRETFDCGFD